ncbi:MAG: S24 family peptidase [Gammaproteobacteria bacterium]|nr:S24 family peptidase [bacterium]MDE0223712.1 S24 family peptidase [Gammaproteobacteria bacterium]
MRTIEDIQQVIERGLKEAGISARKASLLACEREDLIRDIRRGRMPSYDRVAKVLEVLGMSIEIAGHHIDEIHPDRSVPDSLPGSLAPTAVADALGLPSGATLAEVIAEIQERSDHESATKLREMARLLDELAGRQAELAGRLEEDRRFPQPDSGDEALAHREILDNVVDLPGTRHVEIREADVAAGGGAVNLDEAPVRGFLAFQRAWLDRHALDPTQCVVIEVRGESMEPTLPEGCSILVDGTRRRWRKGRIFVFLTGDGLVVKRADEDETGRRRLASDHPAWAPVVFPDDADILGEVAWTARTLRRRGG